MPRTTATLGSCYGIDTDTKLSVASLKQLALARYQGDPIRAIGRYLSLSQPVPSDITSDELDGILGEGFASYPILHAHHVGWMPSEQLGSLDGEWAARNAIKAGYVQGTHLEIDLEGVSPQASKSQVEDWVGAASIAVAKAAGFPVILYDGWDAILGSEELWDLPTVHLYATDIAMRKIAHRGTASEQVAMDVVLGGTGVLVDVDSLHPDLFGDQMRLTVAG